MRSTMGAGVGDEGVAFADPPTDEGSEDVGWEGEEARIEAMSRDLRTEIARSTCSGVGRDITPRVKWRVEGGRRAEGVMVGLGVEVEVGLWGERDGAGVS